MLKTVGCPRSAFEESTKKKRQQHKHAHKHGHQMWNCEKSENVDAKASPRLPSVEHNEESMTTKLVTEIGNFARKTQKNNKNNNNNDEKKRENHHRKNDANHARRKLSIKTSGSCVHQFFWLTKSHYTKMVYERKPKAKVYGCAYLCVCVCVDVNLHNALHATVSIFFLFRLIVCCCRVYKKVIIMIIIKIKIIIIIKLSS